MMVVCTTIVAAFFAMAVIVILVPMPMLVTRAMLGRALFIAVTLRKYLLRKRVVLGEGRIVSVAVTTTICAGFGVKRQRRTLDVYR